MNLCPWLGIAGILSCFTILFPVLGCFSFLFSKRRLFTPDDTSSIEILLPVWNEEKLIIETLNQLIHSCDSARTAYKEKKIELRILLDGPTDLTRSLIQKSNLPSYVHFMDREENLGKWQTLLELISASKANWIIITDVGTFWPELFLNRLIHEIAVTPAPCIAPGYRQKKEGLFDNINWGLERFLKSIENFAGGPVSIHGATMCFHRKSLLEALKLLGGHQWLNDDVVMALATRTQGAIHYLGNRLFVQDMGISENASELGRRQRMARGNLEWIRTLLPVIFQHSPTVGILSLRRVLRVFWGYFGIFLGTFCLLLFGFGFLTAFLVTVVGVIGICFIHRRFREAFIASLQTPYFLLRKNSQNNWV